MRRLFFYFLIINSFILMSIDYVWPETSYRVGLNDVLDINVIGHTDLKTTAMVTTDGSITFPFIGTVHVKGMTLSEIEKEITRRLSEGYINYPVVTVSLIKSLGSNIYVSGEIRQVGEIVFEEGMTVLKALLRAGGVTEHGLYGKIMIKRKQKGGTSGYKVVAESMLNNGVLVNKGVEEVVLQLDDIIIVERNKNFLIEGNAATRGRFELEKGMTVLTALLRAGGVTEQGLYGKIMLKRKQEMETGGYKVVAESQISNGIIENKEVEEVLLQPDDIIVIERNKNFFIEGETVTRGKFLLEKGMTVLKGLLQSGGITEQGLHGKVKIRRKQEKSTGAEEYKVISESKINKGRIENKDVEEILLQPDDIIVIERNEKYFIYGEVNTPGEYVLEEDSTVFKAITLAKGFTKWGSPNKVEVLRRTNDHPGFTKIKVNIEDVIKGDAGKDVFLKPGDTIVVSTGIF